ncbi:MAG: permease-like cell division protein FtsX [Dysgonamonadaceae bacterium]|jgi:cell division transport system permease protein|nr:permease-like cell division protein FtsX [Dysgonamonadaceae bacterium]
MKKRGKLSPVTFINSRITATISIALVLFLSGLVVLLSLFANGLSTRIKETLSIDLILQEGTSKAQIQKLQVALNKVPFAKSIAYHSKEEAAKQLEADLGQNPEEFLGFNPLPDIIVVHLNAPYAHPDSLAVIETQLKRFSGDIQETEYRKELLQVVNENITQAGIILVVIAGLLLFISFALISNTIRLTIYSKRFVIRTMQLVGAKAGFIRRPFILSNLLSGIIAALIACGLLYWLIYYIATNIPDLAEMIDLTSGLILFGSVLLLGMLISWLATCLSVNKYLRANEDDLYKM